MTKNDARMLTGALLSMTISLVLAVLAAPLQAADKPPHTPVYSDGTEGEMPAAESALTSDPFSGTGKLTQEAVIEASVGLVPSWEEIRALQPSSGKVGIESVIGTDTRLRTYTNTYPARAIALITFNGGYCTGWFYAPNVVATAGHCVHSGGSGGTWRTNVRVLPGYNAGSAPYGSFPAKWLASVSGWTQSANEQYDYGVIKLSSNVGNTVGWFGIWWQSASLNELPAILAGYPGDKSPTQSQWLGVDQVRVTQTRQVFYKGDSFGGQSGSAVWQDRPAGSASCANGPCAYAIHAYGLHGSAPHSDHNHGTRITQEVYNNLINWRDAP
jgi:glutamyl endopeptidase